MLAGDQHRVLAVEAQSRAPRSLTVDMLVGVDEDAVAPAECLPEGVQPLPQERVVVAPRVSRQAPLSHTRLGAFDPVTQRGRDDGLRRAVKEQLRMTGDLRPRHRELHVREEALLVPLADVLLGLRVRRRRSSANDVEAELDCDLGELSRRHCNRLGLRAHIVIDSASDPGILGRSPSPGSYSEQVPGRISRPGTCSRRPSPTWPGTTLRA